MTDDVAELVRRVRQVDYAEDAGGYLLKDEVNQLADACERLAAENAKLLAALRHYTI